MIMIIHACHCVIDHLLFCLAGLDYSAVVNEIVTFSLSSLQRQCVDIGIINDGVVEPQELFIVQLVQTTSQGPTSTLASVTIIDGKLLAELITYCVVSTCMDQLFVH